MEKHKVGLIVFSETKVREDVYRARLQVQNRELENLCKNLSTVFDIDDFGCAPVRAKREGLECARRANASDCDAVLLYIPIFINPAIVAHTAKQIRKKIALACNHCADSTSQLGYLAAAGAMEQLGIACKRILASGDDARIAEEMRPWVAAAGAADRLCGETFGSIGGRSLGISTGTADLNLWESRFGIDIESIDQFELVRRAEQVPETTIARGIEYIEASYGKVACRAQSRFQSAHLGKMVASYQAMKSIIADYELDFCGIKCQPELSNGYCLQCFTVQMLNDPYDMDGAKRPFVCSCEADADGALSMQILNLLSGGAPTALQDIAQFDNHGLVLANCGAMASYFAGVSENPSENLAKVHLVEHGFGQAGGAATQFVVAESEFTYMRLFRKGTDYYMGAFVGTTESRPREELRNYSPYRPTSFVKHALDADAFKASFCSNHLHCVCGDYRKELRAFCEIAGIDYCEY